MSSRQGQPEPEELGEFVQERLDRAAAKPAAERTFDEAELLRAYALLDAARLHADAAQQPGSAAAGAPPHDLLATLCSLGCVQALCSVLGMQVQLAIGVVDPVLKELVPQLSNRLVGETCRFFLPGPPVTASLVAALLTVAAADCAGNFRQWAEDAPWWGGLDALNAARSWLFRASAAADVGAELAGLQQLVASGSRGAATLPTVKQLRFLWCTMAHHLAVSRQGQPQEGPRAAEPWRLSPMEAAALDRASAAALCAAAPEHPLGQEALALLVPGVDPVGLRRGLELGRQLNSPSWVAYLAYGVVINASPDQGAASLHPAISPAEARSLLAEADAAYATCKAALFPRLLKPLQHQHHYPHIRWMRAMLAAHEAAGARRWQDRLLLPPPPVSPSSHTTIDFTITTCANCGSAPLVMKVCSACRSVKYCSRACQTAHWKQHKAACAAARGSGDPAAAGH